MSAPLPSSWDKAQAFYWGSWKKNFISLTLKLSQKLHFFSHLLLVRTIDMLQNIFNTQSKAMN